MVYSTLININAELQIKILRKIAKDGKQSLIRLEKSLNRHHPPVTSAVRSLIKKGFLKKVPSELPSKRGRPEKFYDLDDEGIMFLIDGVKISLEEFWWMMFHIYDEKKKLKTKFTISELFTIYEERCLGYKRIHTFPYAYHEVPNLDTIKELNFEEYEKEIIELLGSNGPLTKKEILNLLTDKTRKEIPKRLFDPDFLIIKEPNGQYRLTLLGVQYLISEIYKNLKWEEQAQELSYVASNNKGLLPLIFEKWDWLQHAFHDHILFNSFLEAIDIKSLQQPIQTKKGIQEILDIQRNLSMVYDEKMEEEHTIGMRVYNTIIENKEFELKKQKEPEYNEDTEEFFEELEITEHEWNKIYSDLNTRYYKVSDMLDQIRAFLGFRDSKNPHRLTIEDKVKGYEKITANHLSFRFYSILTSYSYEKEEYKEWFEHFKKEPEIFKWYSEWIKEISEFEEKNVKFRKEFEKNFILN